MKSTATDLRLMSMLDLETSLLKHQQRLATIYSTSSRKKVRRNNWEGELDRIQRSKQQDRTMRSQKRLQQINYENSIIHSKLMSEKERKSPFRTVAARVISPHTNSISDWSTGQRKRQRQRERIDQENIKIVQKLVSARGQIIPERLKRHEQQHHGLLERISKTKKRRQLKMLVNKLQPQGYYFPQLDRARSIRSLNRMKSVSSTRPTPPSDPLE